MRPHVRSNSNQEKGNAYGTTCDGDGVGNGGGIYQAGTLIVKNSLIANNKIFASNNDCYLSAGTLASQGYNLVETADATCSYDAVLCPACFGQPGSNDVTGQDPKHHQADPSRWE